MLKKKRSWYIYIKIKIQKAISNEAIDIRKKWLPE